jgi:hypothetical protein
MTKLRCAREELLIPAVNAGGLEEIRITQVAEDSYVLSIKIKTKPQWTYLATRRNPGEPRRFRRIEAAVAVGNKLFKAKRFTVALS